MADYSQMTYQEFLKTRFADRLNDGQLSFFREFLSSNRNIFLTGGAGTGKSFVLSRFSEFCESEGIFLNKCASTGVAAININSQTLHSFLGVGIAEGSVEVVVAKVKKNKLARKRLENCRLLFIDEISMISGEFLDKFYAIIKAYCRKMPRVLMAGDILQLPPVFKEDRFFAFESDAWEKLDPKVINLTEIKRQEDDSGLADALSKMRIGDKSSLDFFKSRQVDKFPSDCLIVYAKNIEVDEHNLSELRKLPGTARSYRAVDIAPDHLINTLDKCCLAPVNLTLKPGAKVMLLKNDLDNGLSNGSIGFVVSLHDDGVLVKFDGGSTMVTKHQWKIEESYLTDDGKIKTKILASREQIPLRLAFSATIHKTQSLTIDKIGVDLTGCFAPGQMYVSLSRSRTLEGLSIMGLDHSALKVDPRCINFYRMLS